MTPRRVRLADVLLVTVVAFVARIAAAVPVDFPPYSDSAYYTLVADALVGGRGFQVPVIWSFLEVGGTLPTTPVLPVPSNGHWMPLTSIVSAGAMAAFGETWRVGQLPMILLSTALVPLTYLVAIEFFGSRWVAGLAAVLAIFAGPLLVYYPTIENFAVFGAFGCLAILCSCRAVRAQRPGRWLILAGFCAGAATLARIDGVLLTTAPATAWVVGRGWSPWSSPGARPRWVDGFASAAAFALVLGPWLGRNVLTYGSPLPSAGGHTLWITSYNEQFSIGHEVSLSAYLDWGLVNIVASKLASWVQLLGRTSVLVGGLFVVTFFAGLWIHRRRSDLAPFLVYFVVMFIAMGGLFTFHAPAGAYYHSAPAWLPFALPVAVASIPPVATAAGRFWPFLRRRATHRFLGVAGVVGAIALSLIGSAVILDQWTASHRLDRAAASFFIDGGFTDDVVMSSDPAALALLSGNPGVAPSYDPFPVLGQVADAYQVEWVVVQLREGETTDPLGLWEGGDAVDAEGRSPDWLADDPAFEVPGQLRIFRSATAPSDAG